MKYFRKILIFSLLLICFTFTGCGNKSIIQPDLERDNYNTGGNLTFSYDKLSHVATFGGDGEVLQYYNQSVAKGWKEKGNRIGFQIAVPKEVKDFKSGKAVLNGEKLSPNEYITLQEGQNYVAIFQPIIKKDRLNMTLKITWEEGKDEQYYKIIVSPNTIFMEEEDLI